MTEEIKKESKKSKQSGVRGGTRKGAGRPKSSLTVKTREAAEKIMAEMPADETPLAIMVRVMRRFWEEAELKMNGKDPDDHAVGLKLMKMSAETASSAAPYIHPRLAAIEHTGKDGKDLIPDRPGGVLLVPGVFDEKTWEAMMAKHQEGQP